MTVPKQTEQDLMLKNYVGDGHVVTLAPKTNVLEESVAKLLKMR